MFVPVWIEHNVVKPNIYYLFYYNVILEEFESSICVRVCVCVCVCLVCECVCSKATSLS